MKKLPAPRPNRVSYAKHQQDVNQQIILPVVFMTVMVIVFAILIFISTFFANGDVGRWASIAIIWTIIPLMLLLLIILAASIGLVYMLTRTLEVAPRYTGLIQAYTLLINEQIVYWTNRIIIPILKTKAWLTLFSKEED